MCNLVKCAVVSLCWLYVSDEIHAQVKQPAPTVQVVPQSPYQQTPWFSDPTIRKQLNLTDPQFTHLNKAYGEAWTRYNTGVGQLGKLSDQERTERMRALGMTMNQDMAKALPNTITPEQAKRYHQLYMQYRGPEVFSDPQVQRELQLTDEQRTRLQKYQTEYQQQLNTIYQNAPKNPQDAAKQYMELRRSAGEQYNTILNQAQQRMWQQMTGEPFQFQQNFPLASK
jgi:predicted aminopeptidase